MCDFQIVKLIADQATYYPRALYYWPIEIRNNKYDLPEEKTILKQSLEQNKENINFDLSIRLSTLVSNDNEDDAVLEATKIFEEILDILNKTGFMAKFELLNSGYIKNLHTNEIKPIINNEINIKPSMMFQVDPERFPGLHLEEYIFFNKNEILCRRYLNALHWSRIAKWEKNLQLRLLFNWFAIEALIKIDINDNVIPKIMLVLGFPLKRKCQEFKSDFLKQLMNHPNYRNLRKNILNEFIEIKRFRNDSVHRGFRKFDLEPDLLKKYAYLVNNGKFALFSLADDGLRLQLKDEIELWNNSINIIHANNNFINNCHKNFLYSYTHHHFF